MVQVRTDDRLPAGTMVEDDQRRLVVVSSKDHAERRAALLLAAGYRYKRGEWIYPEAPAPEVRAWGVA